MGQRPVEVRPERFRGGRAVAAEQKAVGAWKLRGKSFEAPALTLSVKLY